VTHKNHRGEQVPTDFIFVKQGEARKCKGCSSEQNMDDGVGHTTVNQHHAPHTSTASSSSSSPSPSPSPSSSPCPCPCPSLHPCRLFPIYSTLLPVTLPFSSWPPACDYSLSDHRPVLTVFRVEGMERRKKKRRRGRGEQGNLRSQGET